MKTLVQSVATAFTLLFLVSVGTASGTYPAGNNPYSVVAADVNGDGWPDLICADYAGNTLMVLTNNGSGVFGSNAVYAVGNGPKSVTAADVNGDGWVDLICANHTDNTLTVLTNNGSGGFAMASSPGTVGGGLGTGPEMVIAADINGDGRPDLVSANFGTALGNNGSLTILTNNGTGGFGMAAVLAVPAGAFSVTAADVNGDGWLDLICPNYNTNTLSVFTNNGTGGFALASTPQVAAAPFTVAAADINGDHKIDLVSANLGLASAQIIYTYLTILTNNGSGQFGSNATLLVNETSLYNPFSGSSLLAAADINGDGKVDLLAYDFIGGRILGYTNGGTAGFRLSTVYTEGDFYNSAIATAYVDGSGKPALILAGGSEDTVSVFTNLNVYPVAGTAPALTIKSSSGHPMVSWPSAAAGWSLQQSQGLIQADWTPAGYSGNPICDNGTNQSLTITPSFGNVFYRLIHP